jgi:hypothetical protein
MASYLVDASLPRPTSDLIRSFGHAATDVRDIGLADAADQDFGNILNYPPQDYSGIVVLVPPHEASRSIVLEMVRGFLAEAAVAEHVAGRLVIVERTRIRVRG